MMILTIFSKSLKRVRPANTLGGVNSIIAHPMTMSHRSLTEDELNILGVDNRTYRLSVGLEDAESIVDDIRNAL